MKTYKLMSCAFGAALLLAAPLHAASITVGIGDSGTQIEAGATNTEKESLVAEVGKLWGVSNWSSKDGMWYFTYSDLAGSMLPATIQPGTYVFSARVGTSSNDPFAGLNDISAGANTDLGCVAGFFSSLSDDAQAAKNNMVAEFNAQAGVNYIPPTEADPALLSFTTWTFTWTVEEGSPVIGTDPYFGVYTKISSDGGNGFWDDSTLSFYSAIGELPLIYDFSADTDQFEGTGSEVTLSWEVSTNATALTISPDIGDVLPATVGGIGQTNVFVNTATTFTLESSNGVSVISSDLTIGASPAVINDFSADTHLVDTNGTTVMLSWDVSGAQTVSIAPDIGVVPSTGQTGLVVNVAGIYTLSASNQAGTVTADWGFRLPLDKPNILIVLVDDYGVTDTSEPFAYTSYDDAGVPLVTAFNNLYHTPNMERLAGQGMKFTQAYAMPMCSPTRATLMTGNNTPRHGITHHLNGTRVIDNGSFAVKDHRGPNNWRYNGLTASDVTLPKLLGAEGYRSIHVGKWHLGSLSGETRLPTNVGFDVNIAGDNKGQPSSYVGAFGNDLVGMDEYENTGMFLTDALTQAMKKEIKDAVTNGVPFFGHMSYYACHSPFTTNPDATNDYSSISGNHLKFATMVEGVDISLGEILDELETLGVAEDTLVVFLGDNGSDSPALSDEGDVVGTAFDDYPIRGKKGSAYEGGTRVPLIISWAATNSANGFQQQMPITAGGVEHDLVAVEDIVPTVLASADVAPPEMDGYDLGPYLRSESGNHRPQHIIRHMPHEHRSDYFVWYRDSEWKILYRYHTDGFELYNLAADPDETDDLASAQPERVLTMARAMAQELDASWGIYGELWPTHNPTQAATPARPLEDDPFWIDFSVDGRDAIDSDGDGLTDAEEDPDADGLVGLTETDPDNSDTDGDGSDDYTEQRLNLDPLNPDEAFLATMAVTGSSSFSLTWPSATDTTYNILSNTNLLDAVENWEVAVSNVPADAVSNETSHVVEETEEDSSFFRVELLP